MNLFYKRLKELRIQKKLSLDELSKLLKIAKNELEEYENNQSEANADFIILSANFFNVSTDYLLGLSNNPLTVDDLLNSKQISLDGISKDDATTIISIINEIKNK